MSHHDASSPDDVVRQFIRYVESSELTQSELEAATGISQSQISRILSRTSLTPNRATLAKLRRFVGTQRPLGARAASGDSATAETLPEAPAFRHHFLTFAPAQWVGREDEMRRLDEWLADPDYPLLCMTGPPGIGKTALLQEWLRARFSDAPNDDRPLRVFHWSFCEQADFDAFFSELLKWLGDATGEESLDALQPYLRDGRLVIVLDAFEHLLSASSSRTQSVMRDEEGAPEGAEGADVALPRMQEWLEADHLRCRDPRAAAFLGLVTAASAWKLLVSTRLAPAELSRTAGCSWLALGGIAPGDAVTYLAASGVQGGWHELREAARILGNHPLLLGASVDALAYDLEGPQDSRRALEEGFLRQLIGVAVREPGALAELPEEASTLVCRLANLPQPIPARVAAECARSVCASPSLLTRKLEELGIVQWDKKDAVINFPPLTVAQALSQSENPRQEDALTEVFSRQVQGYSRDDQPRAYGAALLGLYHERVQADQFEAAFGLYEKEIAPRYLAVEGRYHLCIRLLSMLFPGGRACSVHESVLYHEARVLADLGQCWLYTGRTQEAIEALQSAEERLAEGPPHVAAAYHLAQAHARQGAMGEAAQAYARAAAEAVAEGQTVRRVRCHAELSQVLAGMGETEKARDALRAAEAATAEGGPEEQAAVETARAILASHEGSRGEAAAAAQTALVAAERAGDHIEARMARMEAMRVWARVHVQLALEESDESRVKLLHEAGRVAREALELCRETELAMLEPAILLELARSCLEAGDVSEGLGHARAGQQTAQRYGYSPLVAGFEDLVDRCLDQQDATAPTEPSNRSASPW